MNRDDSNADKLRKAVQEIDALVKDANVRAPIPQISPHPPPPKQTEPSNSRFMWFYQHGTVSIGPVGEDVIRQLTDTKVLNDQSLVWREGMTGWVSLVEAGLVTSVPQAAAPPPITQQKQSIFQRYTSWWWTLLISAAFYALATMVLTPDSPSFLLAIARLAGSIMGLFGGTFIITGLLWLFTLCRLKDRAFMITFIIVFYAIAVLSFLGHVFVFLRV